MYPTHTLRHSGFRPPPDLRERVARNLITSALRVRVSGLQLWQAHPDALVVANHISYADGPLLASTSPHPLTYAVTSDFARHGLWQRALNMLVQSGLGRYVAVDAGTPFGMRAIIKALKANTGAMVFPEGAITRTGQLGPLQPGAAIAAQRTGKLILPIRLSGLERSVVGRSGAKATTLLPRAHVEVRAPIDPSRLGTDQILAKIAEALQP